MHRPAPYVLQRCNSPARGSGWRERTKVVRRIASIGFARTRFQRLRLAPLPFALVLFALLPAIAAAPHARGWFALSARAAPLVQSTPSPTPIPIPSRAVPSPTPTSSVTPTAPATAEAALTGPPLRSDLAAWREAWRAPSGGYEPVAQLGGTLRDVALEPARPVAWVAMGPRVVAFDVGGEAPRMLGRTPVLPGLVVEVAAGDGVVVARVDGPGERTWLVDTRDPAWPRSVRPLRVGAPVEGVALDGSRAVVVAGGELWWLELSDPARPVVLRRRPLPGRSTQVRDMAFAGEVVGLATAADEVVVIEGGERERIPNVRRAELSTQGVLTDGTWVVALIEPSGQSLALFDLTNQPFERQLRPSGALAQSAFVLDASLADGRLSLLAVDYMDGSTWLETYALRAGDHPSEQTRIVRERIELENRVDLRLGATFWPGLASNATLHVLRIDGHWLQQRVPMPGESAAPPAVSAWHGTAGSITALAVEGDEVALGTAHGEVQLLAVGASGGVEAMEPRATTRLTTEAVLDGFRSIYDLGLRPTRIWVTGELGTHAFARGDPEPERVVDLDDVRPGGLALAALGGHVYLQPTGDQRLLRFAERANPNGWPAGSRANVDLLVTDMAHAGDTLWLAGGNDTGTAGRLLRADTTRWEQPWPAVERLGPTPLVALTTMGRYLATLSSDGTASANDLLSLVDVRDPGATRILGTLDLGRTVFDPRIRGRSLGDVAAARGQVFVAQPSDGLVIVDATLPDFPDQIGVLPIPGGAHRVIHDGQRLWVGTLDGGLVAVERRTEPASFAARITLPVVYGGR